MVTLYKYAAREDGIQMSDMFLSLFLMGPFLRIMRWAVQFSLSSETLHCLLQLNCVLIWKPRSPLELVVASLWLCPIQFDVDSYLCTQDDANKKLWYFCWRHNCKHQSRHLAPSQDKGLARARFEASPGYWQPYHMQIHSLAYHGRHKLSSWHWPPLIPPL